MAIKLKGDNEANTNLENSGITVNGQPIGQNNKQKKKFSFLKFFFVLQVITTVIMVIFALSPFATALFFLFIGLIWVIGVIGATLFTLGLVWMSDGYRTFVSNLSDFSGELTDGEKIDKLFSFLATAYWFVLFIGIGIIVIELLIRYLNKNKDSDQSPSDRKELKVATIVQIVIFVIASIVSFIFLIGSR